MANLGKFGSLRQNFSQVADFVTIYIAEAHPADRGHFKTGADGGQFDTDDDDDDQDDNQVVSLVRLTLQLMQVYKTG